MRLIDADALLEVANEEGAYGYVDAKQIIDAPTAYDIDKVVEALEELRDAKKADADLAANVERFDLAVGMLNMATAFELAIEIVRKGGVE